MGRPHKPDKADGCWGGHARYAWWCDKKPRKGCLTCWWHKDQEFDARRLKKKFDEHYKLVEDAEWFGRYGKDETKTIICGGSPVGGGAIGVRKHD